MNLASALTTLKAGGGMISPISAQVATLQSLASTLGGATAPEATAVGTALTTLIATANSVVSGVTSSILTTLPILKAANDIEIQVLGVTGPTANFTAALAPITQTPGLLNLVIQAIHEPELSQIVAAVTLDAGQLATVATWQSAIGTASTSISALTAPSQAAIADATNTAKSYGFAKFIQSSKPAYVQDVLSQVTSISID